MTRDHRGRPVVAVTGYGMVSSLGQGVADNWAGLIAGRSGIRNDHAASRPTACARPSPAPSTTSGRTTTPPWTSPCAPASSPPRKRSPTPASARRAIFPARCSRRCRRRRWNGPTAAGSTTARRQTDGDAYDRMIAAAREHERRRRLPPLAARLHRRRHRREARHPRRADLADHRLRLRRDRDPARRRGDPPRRHRRGDLASAPIAR